MRVIIIEEERFTEICSLMKKGVLDLENSGTAERLGISKHEWISAINEVHRSIHYIFVNWAQSHGASCLR